MISDLIRFIDQSPTAFHAVAEVAQILRKSGFQELKENQRWKLELGQKYFVIRNGSSLCCFVTPSDSLNRALILAAHTDSPALKLKPNPEYLVGRQIMWGVEVYGEPLLSSWLNRELGLAGRVVYEGFDHQLVEKNVRIDSSPAIIPQLAIHLDREVNDKGLILNRQDHLSALAGLCDDSSTHESHLIRLLKDQCKGASPLSFDLYLYPLQTPTLSGIDKQLLSAYRLDNLASVHAAYSAMCNASKPSRNTLSLAIFWDNEEIGSKTAQGADSNFLNNVLNRVGHQFLEEEQDRYVLQDNSLIISIDLAHAVNPNYVARHEPRHQIHLEGGIVIKSHANKRYATDALSSAFVIKQCVKQKIPYQFFATRSDIPCGSTVGPISSANTGINTVDIGISELSMHSTREVVACKDHLAMEALLRNLLENVK